MMDEPAPGQVPRRRTATMVIAVVAVLVVGGGAAAVYIAARDTGDEPSASASVSSGQTIEPGQPSQPIGPSAEPSPAEQAFSADDLYTGPAWDYQITAEDGAPVDGTLELIETYDHADCAPAALTDAVREALSACTNRVEAAYHGTVPLMGISEQVLVFDDSDAATAFYEQFGGDYAGDLVRFEDPEGINEVSRTIGYTISRTGGAGRYIVLTVLYSKSQDEFVNLSGQHDMAARNQETSDYVAALNRQEDPTGADPA